MSKYFFLVILSVLFFSSCDKVKESTKKAINKSGEAVGTTASEFVEGVSEGVDRALKAELIINDGLLAKGIKQGKHSIENANGGTDNKLVVYLIFDQDIDTSLTAKAFDKEGLEIGRSKLKISAKKGDASYFDVVFDKRTDIEIKSKITLE